MHTPWLEGQGQARPCGVREWLWRSGLGGVGGSGELCAAAAGSTGATWTAEETVFNCTCSSCFHPALGSAFEPHGHTNLCNLIITLIQPAKDELLTLAGLARPSEPSPASKQAVGIGGKGFSPSTVVPASPSILGNSTSPKATLPRRPSSLEQGSCCIWPRPWWVWQDETFLPPPIHKQPTATQPGHGGTRSVLGQLRQEGALLCRRE